MLLAPVTEPTILLRRRVCINWISCRVSGSSVWVGKGAEVVDVVEAVLVVVPVELDDTEADMEALVLVVGEVDMLKVGDEDDAWDGAGRDAEETTWVEPRVADDVGIEVIKLDSDENEDVGVGVEAEPNKGA